MIAMSSSSGILNTMEKVVLVGDSSVGKTSLISKYINGTFSENVKATVGCDHYVKEIQTPSGSINISLWDTAGQERFRGLSSCYYRKARAILIIYDRSRRETFDKLGRWFNEIDTFADSDVMLYLVSNKSDLNSKGIVKKSEIEKYMQKHKIKAFFETSALDNNNRAIDKMFDVIAADLVAKGRAKPVASSPDEAIKGKRIELGAEKDKDDKLKCAC